MKELYLKATRVIDMLVEMLGYEPQGNTSGPYGIYTYATRGGEDVTVIIFIGDDEREGEIRVVDGVYEDDFDDEDLRRGDVHIIEKRKITLERIE